MSEKSRVKLLLVSKWVQQCPGMKISANLKTGQLEGSTPKNFVKILSPAILRIIAHNGRMLLFVTYSLYDYLFQTQITSSRT